jgi:hypothetical protein
MLENVFANATISNTAITKESLFIVCRYHVNTPGLYNLPI